VRRLVGGFSSSPPEEPTIKQSTPDFDRSWGYGSASTADHARHARPSETKPPRRRRILKGIGRTILGLIVLLIAGLFFLPQIATRLLDRFAEDLELAQFEVEVVEVTWNKATLKDLSAADAGWQARADSILVHYSPWDLFRGQIQQAKLTGLRIDLLKAGPEAGTPGSDPLATNPPTLDKTDDPGKAKFAWLQSLKNALEKCEQVTAPNTQLRISLDQTQLHKSFDLTLRQDASGTPQFTLENESNGEFLAVLLKRASSGSILSVQASLPDPEPWLTTAELFLDAKEPWLPAELALGPLKSDIVLNISDTVDRIELSGTMTGLRYTDEESGLEASSSLTAFEGTIRPSGPSQIELRGDLSTCALTFEALPGGPLNLTAQALPTWSATLAWGEHPFSYVGTLQHLALRGTDDSRPLLVESQQIAFSNRDALFRSDGTLNLNGLEHPFDFILLPETSAPNAHLALGPVTLTATHPLFPPSPEFPEISGTFEATAALRLAPAEALTGTIILQVTNASSHLPEGLGTVGPISGRAQLTLSGDEASPTFGFEGSLQTLTLNTQSSLGFPLAHIAAPPASLRLSGEFIPDQPHFKAEIKGLTLQGENKGQQVAFSIQSLEVESRGPKLQAKASTHFGTTPMVFDYAHERKELPNDAWQLHGHLELSPTRIEVPLTNLGAFSEALEGLTFRGAIDSRFEFETSSAQPFRGSLQFGLTDGAVELKDTLTLSALEARGALEINPKAAAPLSWDLDGNFARLDLDASAGAGFPISYDGSLDEFPASFAFTGTVGEDTSAEGAISKLGLTAEQHGETLTFEDSSLTVRFADRTLEAEGTTTLAGNKVPFKYRHTTQDHPGKPPITTGELQIPVTNLSEPITGLGTFSPSVAGMSFSGQVGATLAFQTGPETDFGGSLDFALADGSLTLPDEGPALSGVEVQFHTPDLKSLHTLKPEAFSVESISYGDLAFTKLRGRYRIQPDGGLELAGFQSNFLGGSLSADPFTYPADDKDFRLDLRFTGLNLGTLTTLFPAFDGRLDGTIDGHLPVVRKNGNYLPERGSINLSPKSAARLRYNADSLSTPEKAIVAAENTDRATVYALIAGKTKTSASVVGQQRAKQIRESAASGTWVQQPDGSWEKA